MARKEVTGLLVVFLSLVLLAQNAVAHEQETLNVILVNDEARPGNVTDVSFVEGNGIVFRMRDSTENASMRISIDNNGDGMYSNESDNVSSWLTRSCELDENGTLVNETCAVSYERVFSSTSQGNYTYQIERKVNDSIVDIWNYTITVRPDIHVEPGQPSVGDCFGSGCSDNENVVGAGEENEGDTEQILYGLVIVSALGIIMLLASIRNEKAIIASEHEESE